jgi:tetratricopeptide (TPR) repeat protein
MLPLNRIAAGFPVLLICQAPACAQGNEEFGRQMKLRFDIEREVNRIVREMHDQKTKWRPPAQAPAQVYEIGPSGRENRVGPWAEANEKRNSRYDMPPVVAPPPPDPEALADAALARGDYDEAIRLFEQARPNSAHAGALASKLNIAHMAKLNLQANKANAQRAVELSRVLKQAGKSLPAQLRTPSPAVALQAAGFEPPSDAMVVDLRGAQSFVVDPAFFKAGATGARTHGQAMRRFIEPPEPGKTLSPLAFAGSPYARVFETPEFDTLMLEGLQKGPAKEPGQLHRAREAFFRRIDALPPQLIHLVTTADDSALAASRLQVKAAYEAYRKRRTTLLHAAGNAALKEMRSMLDGMEAEGWFTSGDNLVLKTEKDPILRANLDERARVVRWRAELYLDEAEDWAYREMAARVTRIMKENSKP